MLTKLLLSALILYCFWCYKIVLCPCGKCSACKKSANDSRWAAIRNARQIAPVYTILVTVLIIAPLFIVAIPFLVPFGAVKIYWEERQNMRRQHSDLTFAWTNPNNLPAHIQDYFAQCDPELKRLGFERDGVYWMKPQLGDYYGALYINHSGTTVAGLTHLFDSYFCSFSSILESGRSVETAQVEPTKKLSRFVDNPRFTAVFVPGQTLSASYQQHQAKLIELSQTTDDHPLVFEADQICDVLQYEGRLFSHELYQYGDLVEPPPTPILPVALSTSLL